jgi:predicted nucleotidyltransferase
MSEEPLIKLPPLQSAPWLQDSTLYLVRVGSKAYGTDNANSDDDFKGFCVPPPKYMLGFDSKFEQAETHEPDDLVVYEIRKYFKLMAACNPSIIESAFVDPKDVFICHPLAQTIIDKRDAFLSRRARHTFSGYAISQLKKMELDKKADRSMNCKHAMHLVRLLRMGMEILRGEGVQVFRPDREELLEIRNGAWTYEQLVDYAYMMDTKLGEAEKSSPTWLSWKTCV